MTSVPLQSLPFDIKFSILANLADIRSLNVLCEAFPEFVAVYDSYRSIIEGEVYVRDALAYYKREACWLAFYRERLYNHEVPRKELLQVVMEYKIYPEPPTAKNIQQELHLVGPLYNVLQQFQPEFRSYSEFPVGKKEIDSIARNHRVIVAIYEQFISTEQLKRLPDLSAYSIERRKIRKASGHRRYLLATMEEERRIMTALYRLFVAMNMVVHDPWLGGIRDSWGFWGNIHVRAVRDFLVDEVRRIVERELADTDHKSCEALTGLVLLHEFPDNLVNWVNGSRGIAQSDLKKQIQYLRELGNERTENAKAPNVPLWNQSLYFLDVDSWLDVQGYGRVVSNLRLQASQARHYRRLRVSERQVFMVPSADVHHVEQFLHSPIDLSASVWDDQRLKHWGYRFCAWMMGYLDDSYGCSRDPEPEPEPGSEGEDEELPERFSTRKYKGTRARTKGTKLAKR
ncbi:hypothetical protein TWF788_009829 [Orbilia oligospora]|uniref:Uncharacterized protein n=1 Tax=Orbilia oligospora TaxID=2813651 RepID=A0A7C8Q297_ORBOL|nr:hypothetical protein TWF788_009829 [Orbilia oligospora]